MLFNPTQGGIAKGIMTEHVDKVHEHMLDLFGQAGCLSIEGIYYSESSFKKMTCMLNPNAGMSANDVQKRFRVKMV